MYTLGALIPVWAQQTTHTCATQTARRTPCHFLVLRNNWTSTTPTGRACFKAGISPRAGSDRTGTRPDEECGLKRKRERYRWTRTETSRSRGPLVYAHELRANHQGQLHQMGQHWVPRELDRHKHSVFKHTIGGWRRKVKNRSDQG